MEKLITRILLLISLIGTPIGVYMYFDEHYVRASEYQQTQAQMQKSIQSIQQSLEYDHLTKQRNDAQQRIWSISDRYEDTNKAPTTVKEELRKLQSEIQDLDDKLKEK